MIANLIDWIDKNEEEGAILVFVPGFDNIMNIKKKLRSLKEEISHLKILCFHSKLPTCLQKEIFKPAPKGVRKVVLSTTIAETSITINDIVYVIDCGMSNQTSYDKINKLQCLTAKFISKAQVLQRKGRAGRVKVNPSYYSYI